MAEHSDDEFLRSIGDRLVEVRGVMGIALGGSRARGRASATSDWDLGLYISDQFSVESIRAVAASSGWTGHVAELGEWGPVMNGGAWLEVEGQKVDLLWRELTTIERLVDEAERGEFSVVRIPFFVAGIATYVPVGELSVNQRVRGSVPNAIEMPNALRTRAEAWWLENARFDLDYVRVMAARGEAAVAVGLLSKTLVELAHARMCAAGRWVLNEKGLLADAGLGDLAQPFDALHFDDIVASVQAELGTP